MSLLRLNVLIKISGGSGGIKDYLENGQKQDRFYDRNQLDERVILNGDLKYTHQLIEDIENTGDKYFHITLAFKEDYISPDVLEKIDNDFKDFFLKAYRDDEVDYYSEVHLPKIKSYETADGQTIVRKPHIHIVIPRENLFSGKTFDPNIEFNIKYLDSFQEATNAKYGLSSPKDNLRTTFNSSSEMISRYKGDEFNGAGKEERAHILKLIIDKNPQSMNELKDLLSENGYEVKTRNNGKPDAYLNIKEVGKAKGINLKDSVFRDEFLSLNIDDKIAKINQAPEVKYHSAVEATQIQDKHLANLDEWNTYKALHCRYTRTMSQKQRELYKDLSIEEKTLHLETLQQKFYEKHQTKILESEIDEPRTNESILESIRENLDANERILTTIESDIARVGSIEVGNDRTKLKARLNRASEARHRDDITNSATIERPDPKSTALDEIGDQQSKVKIEVKYKNRLDEINQTLKAENLLELLAKSHGVNPDIYTVTKDKNGNDRIQCGNRNLTMVDFCTKELNLTFKESVKVLDNALNMQNDVKRETGYSFNQDKYLKQEYTKWLKDYKADKIKFTADITKATNDKRKEINSISRDEIKLIKDNPTLKFAEKKKLIGTLVMNRSIDLKALTTAKDHELKTLKRSYNLDMQNSYKVFLSEQAKSGDEIALLELRKLKADFTPSNKLNSINAVDNYKDFRLDFSYEIDKNGTILYKINDDVVIKDTGAKIEVVKTSEDNLKLSLDLAVNKFGKTIELTGSDEFRKEVVEFAIKNNYKLEFTDEFSKQYQIEHLAKLEQNTKLVAENQQTFSEHLEQNNDKYSVHESGKLTIINDGVAKEINLYKVKSIDDNQEFIVNARQLDYFNKDEKLNHIFEAKIVDDEIKFSITKESVLRNIAKAEILAEELQTFKSDVQAKYNVDEFVSEHTGALIKVGKDSNGEQFTLIKTEKGFERLFNDELADKLLMENMPMGSKISVLVPVQTTKEIEVTKELFKIERADKYLQLDDLQLKADLVLPRKPVMLEAMGEVISSGQIKTKAGNEVYLTKVKQPNGQVKSFFHNTKLKLAKGKFIYIRQTRGNKFDVVDLTEDKKSMDLKAQELMKSKGVKDLNFGTITKIGIANIRGKDLFYAEINSGQLSVKKYGAAIEEQIKTNNLKVGDEVATSKKPEIELKTVPDSKIEVKQLDLNIAEKVMEWVDIQLSRGGSSLEL